jgi:hypothetical protein
VLDSIACNDGAGAIRASLAVNEDRRGIRTLEKLQHTRYGFRRLRAHPFHGHADVMHAAAFDEFLFVDLGMLSDQLGGFQLRLLVPAAFEADALEVLESQISDEELAAQAEAAGTMEDESDEV